MGKAENTAVVRNAIALCAVGAEKVVSNELKKLGLSVSDSGFGRVRFRADTDGLYRSLMGLRAADRILLELLVFPATDFDALFEGTESIAWERLIPAELGLQVVKVRSNRSKLKAETSVQSIVHKAAARRLCTAHGLTRLPEGGESAAQVRVFIEKDIVSILLDLSGEPLFKRGYRIKSGGTAPLRETTAAAMLLLSGWKRKYPLYDPFCGSGTILIEAFMYAWDMAPGLNREFALNKLLIADDETKRAVRGELLGKINFERVIRIAGSDEDAAAVKLAESNIRRVLSRVNMPLPEGQLLRALPMPEAQPPFAAVGEDDKGRPQGFIVTNPPYGKRLGDTATSERIYKEMAALARHFPRWKLAVITDHSGFESFFGRKANSCREIKNGPIDSYIYQYDGL